MPDKMIEIALFQPDIAANTGTIARMAACFGLPLTIIEPAGFAWSDSSLRRSGMDYLALADLRRAASWADFQAAKTGQRVILLTTKAETSHAEFRFAAGDVLLFGRELSGVPENVHAACERVTIAMRPGMRSLNVAVASAIVAAEAMRQLGMFSRPTW